jgi:CheY-like chemotaxis protein
MIAVAIISVFSGSFTRAEEVVAQVSFRTGYQLVAEELLEITSRKFGIPEQRLIRTIKGPPPFFDRLTHERERNTAYIRSALADLVQRDNVIYHGPAAHLLPKEIAHLLRVCIIADTGYRVEILKTTMGLSDHEAMRQIQRADDRAGNWTRFLLEKEPCDPHLYDIVIPMQSMTIEEASRIICENAEKAVLQPTNESWQSVKDFSLAARVGVLLAEHGFNVDVSSSAGDVSLTIKRYVTRLKHYQKRLESLVRQVEGVKSVRSNPGTKYIPPPLTPTVDIDLPAKVLLVDDEREFVHTLSERLRTRNLDSAVVYDGEQALSFIDEEMPEVMVLDLKMPGIDGMDVLRRVKRDHPEIEVIILTGHGSEKEKRLAADLGAFAYLQKPVDIDVLAETMRAAYKKVGRFVPKRDGAGE